ncbi:MAG: carotenoid biosynthesis protein [candidate division WOR-3 bacterium]|nr:MAG: carotenoid biosynthesis protein [candidate division WOR-3 bacterium]
MNPGIRRFFNDKVLLFVLYAVYAAGIVGHAVDITFPYMLALTPYVLLISGAAALLRTTGIDIKFMLWCLGTFIFTFAVEVLGVHSGIIFGEYHYGGTLGIKFLEVPLVIGLYWVIVVLGAITIASRLCNRILAGNCWCCALLAGSLTAVFDIPLEIVAVNLDYWQWTLPVAPLQNYIAWFIVAFLVTLSYCKSGLRTKGTVIIHYFVIQFLFLILLDILIFAKLL